eukprot:Nitzschia sp. Nitz4//scaffold468_size5769//118//5631//NITZ4_009203-RA/size5769-snap-gene-0.0-mRNA-1//-1//CDS//3329552515//4666//frame0
MLKPLHPGSKNLIRIFQDYIQEQQEILKGNNIDIPVDVLTLDPEDFDAFRINRYASRKMTGMSIHSHTSVPSPLGNDFTTPAKTGSSPRFGTGVVHSGASFSSAVPRQQQRNSVVKRDKNHYKEYKSDKLWDEWENSTRSTARAHGCGQVLDANYVPSSDDELVDFVEQQSFMYSVFVDKVQTLQGKRIINKYKATFDAQKVFAELSEHAMKSTSAALTSSNILTFLTSDCLDLETWKFTTEDYVLVWLNKLRVYEEMSPNGVALQDPTSKAMLQNAVSLVTPLNAIKDDELRELTYGRSPLSFSGYQNLLLSACSTLDQHLARTRRTKPRHMNLLQAQELHVAPSSIETNFHDMALSDKDDYLEAYRTQTTSRPTMRGEVWRQLSKEGQSTWDLLSEQDKRLILDGATARQSRQVSFHDTSTDESPDIDVDQSDVVAVTEVTDEPNQSLEAMAHDVLNKHVPSTPPPGNIHRLLGQQSPANKTKNVGARSVNVTYHVCHRQVKKSTFSSLVDRGANGGIAGDDVRIIFKTDRRVDVSGLDSHEVNDLPIVSVGGVVQSQAGALLLVFHQYGSLGRGKTIHSSLQLESYGNHVFDMSSKFNPQGQRLVTPDGYVLPLDLVNGLPYLPIRPYTDSEWEELPHVIMTSDVDWDPSVHDHTISDDPRWYNKIPDPIPTGPFDLTGQYRFRSNVELDLTEPPDSQDRISVRSAYTLVVSEHQVSDRTQGVSIHPDAVSLQPYFLYQDPDLISRTFRATTRFARTPMGRPLLHKTFRSPFPACNVHRRNEPVATDTIKSSCPSLDGDQCYAQIFVGRHSLVIDVFPLLSPKHFVTTLEDVIRYRGAMDTIISDRGTNEISHRVKDILRALHIRDWTSEAHYQHQNHAERRYRDLKTTTNLIFNLTGAPPESWLFCLQYVAHILNHTATRSLGWRTPLEKLTGVTPDISAITRFRFWEPVYFATHDPSFPSDSTELLGRFLGFASHVGHALTFHVLNIASGRVLQRSQLRSAVIPGEMNARLPPPPPYPPSQTQNETVHEEDEAPPNGEPMAVTVPFPIPDPIETPTHRSTLDETSIADDDAIPSTSMDDFDPASLIGRTFLSPPRPDGQRFRSRIAAVLEDQERRAETDPAFLKFKCVRDADNSEDVMAYHEFAMALEEELEHDGVFKFRRICSHQGPLTKDDPEWIGSNWNLQVEWENGEITTEPLSFFSKEDPVSCAIYGKNAGLLELPGWKRFKRLANREVKLVRMLNQAKLQSARTSPIFMFGFQVPRNHREAVELDLKNGNTNWQDAERLELQQLYDYNTFRDLGHKNKARVPKQHKVIRVHFVYATKHNGRHKARLVAGGHLTDTPLQSVYSGVVSTRNLRIIVFLGELNSLSIWSTDGTGEVVFHLGCDYWRDKDGTMVCSPRKYIEKILVNYKQMFGVDPRPYASPLEKGDHPELDDSPECDLDDIKRYQSIVGSLQWAVTLGRFDIMTAVMTLSSYRAFPRIGHLQRARRIVGYLAKMKHGAIRIRTEVPDLSDLPDPQYDWDRSIYVGAQEELSASDPPPLGKPVKLISYVDANLFHDLITGRSVTGVLHLANQTPIEWFSKKQSTVETATYGSEFVAARTATEQIMEIRATIRSFGVAIIGPTCLFGDNKSVVDSAMVPQSVLHKRHVALSYHRVREAIAANVISFFHLSGHDNPADILTKFWGFQQVWSSLQPLLFWVGDTMSSLREQINGKPIARKHGE